MSIVFKCECGVVYEVADVAAGRSSYCLRCKRPVMVPTKTRPEPPPAARAAGVQAAPPEPSAKRSAAEGGDDGPGTAGSQAEPPGEVPSLKRGFNRINLALIA